MSTKAYSFPITAEEVNSLRYIADRYTYAEVLYNLGYTPNDDESDDGVIALTEGEAWEVQEACEAEDGWLTLMGGELKEKLETLLYSIV